MPKQPVAAGRLFLCNCWILSEWLQQTAMKEPRVSNPLDNGSWMDDVIQVPSPNRNARPEGCDIELIVIHAISLPPGEFSGDAIQDLFLNRLNPNQHPYFKQIFKLQVSSHLLIRRDGRVIQFVPFVERAWHAGESIYEGRSHCNDFSIGVELEGSDTQPFEMIQYRRLARCIAGLMRSYPQLDETSIVAHSEISPGRKTDPGPCFDWSYLTRLLALEDCSEGQKVSRQRALNL